jgi:pimeloyl-ACP methyl ester carboxylesterase
LTLIKANGIDIEYATRGNKENPALVLVRGLGTQLVAWPNAYLEAFVDAGFYVVIFDNRDVGLSQKFGEFGPADRDALVEAMKAGQQPDLAYTLDEMAADPIALMDALGIEKAHIWGMSMGGMIVQVAAANYPDRLLSVTSVMSGVGDPTLPQPGPEVMRALTEVCDSEDLEDIIAHSVAGSKVYTGKGRPTSDEDFWERERNAITRCYYPEGTGRQMAAIIASGDRSDLCRGIDVPFLVVHGTDDPLVLKEAGIDMAEKVPGAKLHLVEGMGHDLPPSCREEIIGVVVAHMRSVD